MKKAKLSSTGYSAHGGSGYKPVKAPTAGKHAPDMPVPPRGGHKAKLEKLLTAAAVGSARKRVR